MDENEVARLAGGSATRLMPLLVRCGGCRFVAPAQDVAHIIAALEAAGDYVRDVSPSEDGFERRSRLIADGMDIMERRHGRGS